MNLQTTKPQTETVKGFQSLASYLILSLILAFIGFQVYYLVITLVAK